jgi:hypothetical protein
MAKRKRAIRVRWLDFRISRVQIMQSRGRLRRIAYSGRCLACRARLYRYEDLGPVEDIERYQVTANLGPIDLDHFHVRCKAMDIKVYPPLAWNFWVDACARCAYHDRGRALRKAVDDKARHERNDYDLWLEASYLGTASPTPGPDAIFSDTLTGSDDPRNTD